MTGEPKNLSAAAEDRLAAIARRYPRRESAIMPALFIAQEELGWVSDEAIAWVAERLELSPARVIEVATFYTMYYRQPVGKYHVQVCRTLSCALCGGQSLVECLRKRFGVGPNTVTPDGMFSYEEVECLGSCGSAPVVEINDIYFENLTPETLDVLLERIEREKPDLRYSTVREKLGAGLSGVPKSAVWKEL
jgi:NADH-quinone oxidoreductase E subunit